MQLPNNTKFVDTDNIFEKLIFASLRKCCEDLTDVFTKKIRNFRKSLLFTSKFLHNSNVLICQCLEKSSSNLELLTVELEHNFDVFSFYLA